jgi:hypothetical protein
MPETPSSSQNIALRADLVALANEASIVRENMIHRNSKKTYEASAAKFILGVYQQKRCIRNRIL